MYSIAARMNSNAIELRIANTRLAFSKFGKKHPFIGFPHSAEASLDLTQSEFRSKAYITADRLVYFHELLDRNVKDYQVEEYQTTEGGQWVYPNLKNPLQEEVLWSVTREAYVTVGAEPSYSVLVSTPLLCAENTIADSQQALREVEKLQRAVKVSSNIVNRECECRPHLQLLLNQLKQWHVVGYVPV